LTLDTVLLDVGGLLLLPSHGIIRRALGGLDAHLDRTRLDAAHYRALSEVEDIDGQPVGFAVGPYWVAYARAAGVGEEHCQRAGAAIQEVQHRQPVFTRPVPGCRAGLRAIAATGVRIALVSNTEHGHVEAALRRLGICQVGGGRGVAVAAIVDSHVVGVAKPDPAIFRLALAEVGGSASRAVHVGDSLRADVRGALGAGVAAIHFDPLCLCPSTDHPHAASLTEVAVQIREIQSGSSRGSRGPTPPTTSRSRLWAMSADDRPTRMR
jgi:putative hydrolase of the HAD superfamily